VIIAFYDTLKKNTRVNTLIAIILSTLTLYFFEWLVHQQSITNDSPLRFLIYFLLGIYMNDNYEQIRKILEKTTLKKVMMLAIPIIILPFFTMLFWIDARCGTQFSNYFPHYTELALISEAVLHIFIIVLCMHLILSYKPKSRMMQNIGEYSYGIYFVHAVFHNLLAIYILPAFSISLESLTYYIILFSVTMLSSYFAVKIMLTNNVTAFILTGKQQHTQIYS
jgi:membrane-bound acyltransferase YfiQ involved in biofilm formation